MNECCKKEVRDALEMAAKICDDRIKKIEIALNDENDKDEAITLKATAWQFSIIAHDIRALIDQPEPPASQELMDYETNAALQNAHEISDSDAYFNARPNIVDTHYERKLFTEGHKKGWQALTQLSKPAKG